MLRMLTPMLVAVLLAIAPTFALAGAAGSAKGVTPSADAALDGETRTLKVGSDVFIGDLVQTGPKGQVQILFADDTELVVGPHSSLEIEDYLIRNDGSAGQLAVNMLSGAFRFATGDSAKARYRIDTPTGTIGVRGTGFDVFVLKSGVARVMMYHGVTLSCADGSVCKTSGQLCEITEIGDGSVKILGDARRSTGDFRRQLKAEFIYSENEAPLLRQFRIAHAYECLHNPPDVPVQPHDDGSRNGNGNGRNPVTTTPTAPTTPTRPIRTILLVPTTSTPTIN